MEFTSEALLTFSFFGWVVHEQDSAIAIIGDDHFGPVRVRIEDMNEAALTEEQLESLAGHASSCSEAIYHAHTDWCQSWEYEDSETLEGAA